MEYTSKFKAAEIDARLEKMVNVTYAELVALRDEGKLIAAQKYRMTDYETTCTWENTQVAGHPFDLVLTALDNKTLDEKCSAIWSERDTDGYFANSNLPAWDVRYCLDNDTRRFDWAQLGGRIVTVEFNGMYQRGGSAGEIFTIDGVKYHSWGLKLGGQGIFGLCEKEFPVIGDTMLLSPNGQNILGSAIVSNVQELQTGKGVIYRLTDESENSVPYDFKNIMFSTPLTEGKADFDNGVEIFCYTFSCIDWDTYAIEDQSVKEPLNCYNNKFAIRSYYNVCLTFSEELCYSNTFGSDCVHNILETSCYENTFGTQCRNNILREYCSCNTFGHTCQSNILGVECLNNVFGIACYDNTLGDNCYNNTFGNECYYNYLPDNCVGNTFAAFCEDIVFINEETVSDGYEVLYYHLSSVRGAEIQVYRGRKYDTYITKDKNGNIVEYTVDDIINK